jgi:enoyl-CoA hydratase
VQSNANDLIQIRFEERTEGGRVAYVTVNNAERRNALNTSGRRQFADAINSLASLDDLKVVVVTGAGNQSFIGGADIKEMNSFDEKPVIGTAHLACDCLRRLPVPVIGRVNGYCLGAGMEIAASCDMRVASTNAKFGMPEVKFGLISGMEACLLPQLIGWGKTRELVLTGMLMDAEEAYRTGFVERLVAPEELDTVVKQWVDAIVQCGPQAVRLQKRLVQNWEKMSITDAVQEGIHVMHQAYATGEYKELTARFLNRKKG